MDSSLHVDDPPKFYKTYGMPDVTLALNIAWELQYAILGLEYKLDNIQTWVNVVYFFA